MILCVIYTDEGQHLAVLKEDTIAEAIKWLEANGEPYTNDQLEVFPAVPDDAEGNMYDVTIKVKDGR